MFNVNLSSPSVGATISDATGQGTIVNDDVSFSINDISTNEGNSGTTAFTFTVTKAGVVAGNRTVDYSTSPVGGTIQSSDATCDPGDDYLPASGTSAFGSGDTTQTMTVFVCGDTTYEVNQLFNVSLSNPSPGATISDNQGQGTIVNDDALPTLTIDDVSKAEGDSGTTAFTFTVTKLGATEVTASVNWATAPGTATAGATCAAGVDYISDSGSLTFGPLETTKTIVVSVCGDNLAESDETFFVNLSSASQAAIADPQGLGTIQNEDAAPVVSAGGPYSGAEGAAIALDGTASDTDDTPTLSWSYVVVSGVDAGALCAFSNASIEDSTFTCTDDGTYRVTLTASDGTNTRSASADVVVNNLAPAVTITGPASGSIYAVGTPVTFTGTFIDPGTNDTHNLLMHDRRRVHLLAVRYHQASRDGRRNQRLGQREHDVHLHDTRCIQHHALCA